MPRAMGSDDGAGSSLGSRSNLEPSAGEEEETGGGWLDGEVVEGGRMCLEEEGGRRREADPEPLIRRVCIGNDTTIESTKTERPEEGQPHTLVWVRDSRFCMAC